MDIRLGRDDGVKLSADMLERDPKLLVVMITAYASVQTAIKALRAGVYDYLCKCVRLGMDTPRGGGPPRVEIRCASPSDVPSMTKTATRATKRRFTSASPRARAPQHSSACRVGHRCGAHWRHRNARADRRHVQAGRTVLGDDRLPQRQFRRASLWHLCVFALSWLVSVPIYRSKGAKTDGMTRRAGGSAWAGPLANRGRQFVLIPPLG